ncbi:MAG: hypothetical protein FWG63_01835 [Defluviitaleaceae bacterium]|nr:hypothetical protein [Defluviitaleaceae bacterium]
MTTQECKKFDNGTIATINKDNSVTVKEKNLTYKISGFSSRKNAETFSLFGDFDLGKDNDYILCTNSKEKLVTKEV